jgi:hypothetical protein
MKVLHQKNNGYPTSKFIGHLPTKGTFLIALSRKGMQQNKVENLLYGNYKLPYR